MAKRRQYSEEFRRLAVERMQSCGSISALALELGLHRRLLYNWRDRYEPKMDQAAAPESGEHDQLRLQIAQLQRLVADKTLEADFFKGALQKVGARRQSSIKAGETASTTKSGS